MATMRNRCKSRRCVGAAGFLILLACIVWPTGSTWAMEELDAIVAVVNDDIIVRSELEHEIDLVIPQMQSRGTTPPSRDVLRNQVLERLILKRLQLQEAKKLGIEVDETTLTQAMTNIASRNGMSLEELQTTLATSGIRFEDFREDTRMQILTSRLQNQEVMQNITVTEPEIDRFLERESSSLIERTEVRLSHILIAVPEGAPQAQGQRTRVDALDTDNVAELQKLGKAAARAPVGGRAAGVAHHDTAHVQVVRFEIVGCDTVVADLRIGEGDDLAGVRRIGDHLGVAGHAGVEYHLPGGLAAVAQRPALQAKTVFESQNRPPSAGAS